MGGSGEVRQAGRAVPVRLLGMSLFLAWEIVVAPFEAAWGVPELAGPVSWAHVFTVLTVALLVAAACRARATGWAPRGLPFTAACTACAVLVPVFDLLAAALALPGAAVALRLLATACKAAASAGLFLAWSECLAGQRAYVAWTAYAASFVATVGLFLAAYAAGSAGMLAAAVVLPLASGAALVAADRLPREEPVSEGAVVWHFPWRPVILMVAFSFAYRLAQYLGGDSQVASELGRLAVSAVVLVCFVTAFDRFDAGLLYKVCPALVVAGLLLCVTGGGVGGPGLRSFLVSAGYSGFTLYVYLTLNTVCYRFGAPSAWLFGVTRAVCLLVGIPSSLLGGWLDGLADRAAAVDAAACGVVVALVLLSMLLLTDKTSVTTWGIKAVRVGGDEVGAPAGQLQTMGYLEDRVYRCAMVARHFGLTHREEEVLSLLAQGSSLQQIEEELTIAHGTLRAHVQHIYAKLGVHSYEEARDLARTWKP